MFPGTNHDERQQCDKEPADVMKTCDMYSIRIDTQPVQPLIHKVIDGDKKQMMGVEQTRSAIPDPCGVRQAVRCLVGRRKQQQQGAQQKGERH